MMFDPPDYPYKELSDTLKENYDPADLLMPSSNMGPTDSTSDNKSLAEVTEQMITSVENQLSFQSNDSGRFFNIENTPFLQNNLNVGGQSTELYVVQPNESLFNYETTLLDENTVNQFLLPIQVSSENNDNKDAEIIGPDILALHSCLICHDIFTTDADLLDHTISVHATDSAIDQTQNLHESTPLKGVPEPTTNGLNIEAEWLICTICERVLSTALEVEPSEQLCCPDDTGKGSVASRKLHTMFVCDNCSGLFADGEALDRHRLTCFIQDQPVYYTDQLSRTNAVNPLISQSTEICFSCDACGKQYFSTEELKIHSVDCQRPLLRRHERRPYNTNNSNKMWNCGSCNQLFATARELYRHKRGEDRPPGAPLTAYVCEECDKVLGSMCALHTHKKMHKVTKPVTISFACLDQSPRELYRHKRGEDRPPGAPLTAYVCEECDKVLGSMCALHTHKKMHKVTKPVTISFACLDQSPRELYRHKRGEDRPPGAPLTAYVCEECDKVLGSMCALHTHKKMHKVTKPVTISFACLDQSPRELYRHKRGEDRPPGAPLTAYVCEECDKVLGSMCALHTHKKMHKVTKPVTISFACLDQSPRELYRHKRGEDRPPGAPLTAYVCEECDKVLGSMCALHTHKKMHKVTKPVTISFACLDQSPRELYRHKRGEDRPPGAPLTAYVCEECDKVLGSMCALHTHKKMHKVTKPGYPCRVCGRRFNQSGHLAIHMRMHTGERPYPCDLCPKAFKVKVERDDHRRTHTGERPFACAACPKTFTAAARLREHARIHTDQRPYRCDICGAAFRRPYARTVHTLIHTGEKPHECDVCGTAFRRSGDMWKHKRTLHGIQAASSDA